MFIGTGIGLFVGLSDIEAPYPFFGGTFLLDDAIFGILDNDVLG